MPRCFLTWLVVSLLAACATIPSPQERQAYADALAYAGAPTAAFTTKGLESSPWLLRAGLGLSSTIASGTEISARYDAEHRTGFLNQTASVKFRWEF